MNILYLPFLTSNEKRNAGDREGIMADFMCCYNVCLLLPPPQMRQCIIVSDCFHCFVFKLPAQIWVLYQMWKFASQQIPEGCAAMCMWDVATSSVCPHFSLFVLPYYKQSCTEQAWVSAMNIFFSHIFPLYARVFPHSVIYLSDTHNFLFKPSLRDEWKMRPHGVLCERPNVIHHFMEFCIWVWFLPTVY